MCWTIVWCPVVWGSTTWWDLSLPNDHWPVSARRAFMCTLHIKTAAQSESHIPLFARDGRQPAARKADRYHTTAVKESECPLPHSCSKWKIEIIHKTIWIPQHKICKSGLGVGVWQWRTHTRDDKMLPQINLPMLLQGLDAIHQTLNCSTTYKILTTGDYQVRSMKETNAQKLTFQCLENSTKNDTLTGAPSVPWIHSTTNDSQMPLPFKTNHYMKHSLCDCAKSWWSQRCWMREYEEHQWEVTIHHDWSTMNCLDRHVQQVWYIQWIVYNFFQTIILFSDFFFLLCKSSSSFFKFALSTFCEKAAWPFEANYHKAISERFQHCLWKMPTLWYI